MARKFADEPIGNSGELGRLLNISIQQAYNLANSGILPKSDNGIWNLASCAHAYIKYLQGRAGEERQNYALERTRLTKAQADKTELELQVLRAGVVHASTIETVWGRMTGAARARLLALPYRLAQAALAATDFQTIEASATALITEALLELHDYNPADYLPSTDSAGRRLAVETAADPDGKPVGRPRAKAQPRGQRRTGPVEH